MTEDYYEIAYVAYQEIFKAIAELEGKHNISCAIPEYIWINGNKFYTKDLTAAKLKKHNDLKLFRHLKVEDTKEEDD